MINRKIVSVALSLTVLVPALQAMQPQESPLQFTQQFYNWYVSVALKSKGTPASDLALKMKASLFSSELLKALQDDSAAQASSPGEIVGIDWDPFLNSQDPANQYDAVKVTQSGERTFIDVHSVESGRRSPKPDVVVELRSEKGRWIFVNFHSTDGHNLLASLKALAEERKSH